MEASLTMDLVSNEHGTTSERSSKDQKYLYTYNREAQCKHQPQATPPHTHTHTQIHTSSTFLPVLELFLVPICYFKMVCEMSARNKEDLENDRDIEGEGVERGRWRYESRNQAHLAVRTK